MYNEHLDALKPYGKTINGFLIVEGWHVHCILWIMIGCLFCSICVAAVTTAASHSLDSGLAAGSYAVGFGATALALLTFLSAIIEE
jgi:hypothetical protein